MPETALLGALSLFCSKFKLKSPFFAQVEFFASPMFKTAVFWEYHTLLNPFTTGNPFLGTKLLGFSIGRGSGALKGLNTASFHYLRNGPAFL